MVGLLGAGAFGTVGAVPVNLIENGSFEANAVASGTWVTLNDKEMAAWDVKGLGVEIRNDVAGAAYDGQNFVELDAMKNSWIAQTIETIVNQTYLLSFFYAPRMGIGTDSNIIDVIINGGQPILSVTGSGLGASGNVWQEYTYSFVATKQKTTLEFSAAGVSDGYGGSLDNVSVYALQGPQPSLPAAAIPEPTTWSMMLAGLASAALVSRRRVR